MKILIYFVLLGLLSVSGWGQNYVKLTDQSGMSINPLTINNLNIVSNKIDSLINSNNSNDTFYVFDAGLYLHNGIMDGSLEYFNQVKELISESFYLLFVRQFNSNGKSSILIELNLPRSGSFSCFENDELESMEEEMMLFFEENNRDLFESELVATNYLFNLLKAKTDCCTGNREMTFTFDPSKVVLEVFFPDENNAPCSSGKLCIPANENEKTYFRDDKSPVIAYKIKYNDPLGFFGCLDLEVTSKVVYEKPIVHNNCLNTTTYEEVAIIQLYDNKIYYCLKNLDFGGKAEIILKDLFGNLIKEFKFEILGENPKIGEVLIYLNKTNNKQWWMKQTFIHESGNQGKAASDKAQHYGFNKGFSGHNDESGYPLCTYDCGYGLMQLTTQVSYDNVENIWKWKKNIDRNLALFDNYYYRYKIYTDLKNHLDAVNAYNDEKEIKVSTAQITYGGIVWTFGLNPGYNDYPNDVKSYFVNSLGSDRSIYDGQAILMNNCYGCSSFLKSKVENGIRIWYLEDGGTHNSYVKDIVTTKLPKL